MAGKIQMLCYARYETVPLKKCKLMNGMKYEII